jgi:hypothetical protein
MSANAKQHWQPRLVCSRPVACGLVLVSSFKKRGNSSFREKEVYHQHQRRLLQQVRCPTVRPKDSSKAIAPYSSESSAREARRI